VSQLAIEYQTDLQDHHVVISDVAISDEQIEGMVDATTPIIRVAFESNETFQRYAAAWIR